jgi:hypothetical protein
MNPSFPAWSFYLFLTVLTDVGLALPPLRFISALMLLGFLPGYFIVQRARLWEDPFSAWIGSLGISFLVSPLIVLPACLILGRVTPWPIIFSINLFLLGMTFWLRGGERFTFSGDKGHPHLPTVLAVICFWVLLYLDLTGLGPYCSDWTYLAGIVKEFSRHMPPRDPEASFLLLRYQWGFWFFYGLLHRLSDLSVWRVLAWGSVYGSFIFLGLLYLLVYQVTKDRLAGFWAVLLFAVGRHSEWIIQGLFGQGWRPAYVTHMSYEFIKALTGYALLWGWYTLPGLIPPLLAFYFLVRHVEEGRRTDLWCSLGACSISPFFHPIYYFGFLGGFSLLLFFQVLRREFHPRLLLFYLTFIPFFLTFYLFLRPHPPEDPIYRFIFEKQALIKLFWLYLFFDGIAIPFAFLAAMVSPGARKWFLPFFLLFAFLCLGGSGMVNHAAHFALQNSLYLTLMSAAGLAYLFRRIRRLALPIYALVLLVIFPPYLHEVVHRIQGGWEGLIDQEQQTAAAFIRSKTDPKSTFAVLPESSYALTTVIGLGERKVTLGYHYHLDRYESKATIEKWDKDIKAFFLSVNPKNMRDFIQGFGVDYLFFGPDEKNFMALHGRDVRVFRALFPVVFDNGTIEILKARGALRLPATDS